MEALKLIGRAVGLIVGFVLCVPLIVFIPALAADFGIRVLGVIDDIERYSKRR